MRRASHAQGARVGAALAGNDYERDLNTEQLYLSGGGMLLGHVVYDESASLPQAKTGNGALHVFMPLPDRLGSTSFVIDHDTGELVESMTYQPYGATESDYRPDNRWEQFREDVRYTSHWDDSQVGLVYFGARYYAPTIARWISPDPLAIHGFAGDPNPYAFVRGSPIGNVDPYGLDGQDGSASGQAAAGAEEGAAIAQAAAQANATGSGMTQDFSSASSSDPGGYGYAFGGDSIGGGFGAAGQGGSAPIPFGEAPIGSEGPSFAAPASGPGLESLDRLGGSAIASSAGQGPSGNLFGAAPPGNPRPAQSFQQNLRDAAEGAKIGAVIGVSAIAIAFGLEAAIFGARLLAARILGTAAAGGAAEGGAATLTEAVGDQETANLVNQVLRGRKTLDALKPAQRQAAAQFYRAVSQRVVGNQAEAARLFNLERARFLEGLIETPPGTLPEFIARMGLR